MLLMLIFLYSAEPEFRSPRVKYLWDKWRNVWMLEWERQRLLYDHLAYLKEKERADNFSWDDWRRRVSFSFILFILFLICNSCSS